MEEPTVFAKQASPPSANRILAVSGLGLLFDSMDVALMAYVLVALAKQWSIGPDIMGLLGSMSFIGMAIGSALAGLLADRFGRKQVFMWTLLLYSIMTGLTAFAPGVAIFLLLRFLVGMGLGGELPVATTYVLESSPEEERGRRVVLLESFWAMGALLAALISFFVIPHIGWRMVFLIGAIPAFYVLVLRVALPESPRFHSLKNRKSAWQSFCTIWKKELLHRTIVTSFLWFIMNFAYYGMFLWLPSVLAMKGYSLISSIGYVLIMILAQLPGYLTAAWLVERWGRKRTLIIAMLFAAFSALGFGLAANTIWLVFFGLLLSFFMLAAFAATYIFTVEQFPTSSRASGMGWAAGFGRIGGIIAPFLVGILLKHHVSFLVIFSIFFLATLAGFFAVWAFGRETKGSPLI